MADTISVRFDEETRSRLEVESAARGIGISTFVRELAEAQLQRVRQERIRAETQAVTEYLLERPTAFDDDDPSDLMAMPVEVVTAHLTELVGTRLVVMYKDGSKAKPLSGVLERVPSQANGFAIGKHLIALEDVKSIERRG